MKEIELKNNSGISRRQTKEPDLASDGERCAGRPASSEVLSRPQRASNRAPLMFYTQHLSGTGHLVRTLILAEALVERFEVTVVSGGKLAGIKVPECIRFIQLPAIRVACDKTLRTWDRRRNLRRVLDERRRTLQELYVELKPAVIVVECFPFCHLPVMGELLPLLNRAKMEQGIRPLLFCSVRDIVEPTKVNTVLYDDLACMMANYLYDGVLVHSDPRLFRFEETVRPSFPLTTPLHYTGYVTRRCPSGPACTKKEPFLIVSAGGGRSGALLFRNAVDAYKSAAKRPEFNLLLITGPFFPEPERRKLLRASARVRGIRIVRWRTNFHSLIRQSSGLVSQCGYNTSMDILTSGVPALVVPFAEPHDIEQVIRAKKLARLGLVRFLPQRSVTPRALYRRMQQLLHLKPARGCDIDLDGARTTSRLLAEYHDRRVRALSPATRTRWNSFSESIDPNRLPT